MNHKEHISLNAVKLGFIVLCLALGVLSVYFYKNIISYVMISLIFVYFFNPVVGLFENLGISRLLAVLLLYVLIFSGLFFIAYFLIPILFRQLLSMATAFNDFISMKNLEIMQLPYLANLQSILEKLQQWFPFIDLGSIINKFKQLSNDFVKDIPSYLITYSGNIVNFLSYFITVPVISFFILKDQIYFRKSLFEMVPNRYFELVVLIIDKIDKTIGNYLRTLLIEVIIVGFMTSVVLSLLGVKYGILIGVMAGLFNAIPYLGPLSGVILACISVILTGKPMSTMIYTIFGMWGVQLIDNNVIYPLVMSKGTEIHPLYILLTVIAGGVTFGVIGMFVSVPALYLIRGVMQVLYKNLKDFEII